MGEYLRLLREQIDKLNTTQKWVAGGVSGAIFLALLSFVFVSTTSSKVVLFKDLDLNQAAQIKTNLEKMNVEYELLNNGTTFLIDPEKKSEVMITLAENDSLPKTSKGFDEIFGKRSSLSDSKERFRQDRIRAKQGELEITIKSFPSIKEARIHIFESEERLFQEDQKTSKASVTLDLKNGITLKPGNIKSIINIISHSTGISNEAISIVDQDMNNLSELVGDDEQATGLSVKRLILQKKIAMEKRLKIQRTLDKVLGKNSSDVNVTVELFYDQVEIQSKDIAPPIEGEEQGLAVSTTTMQENYEGNSPIREGQPGVDSNIPPSYPGVKKGKTKYSKSDQKTNYDFSTRNRHEIKALGTIKKLSISAYIDEKAVERLRKSNKEDPLKILEKAIATSVGFDKMRGDSISVIGIPFNKDDQKMAAEKARKERLQEMIAKIAIVSTPVLFLLVIFVILWRRWESKVDELEPDLLDISEIIEPEEEIEIEESKEEEIIPPEILEQMEKVTQIKNKAGAEPDSMSRLLQLWLSDE